MESAAAALRLEEMTAVLESQQRELESLRASARPMPSAREQRQNQHQHQQEGDQREVCLANGEKCAPQISPLIRTCVDECASAVKEEQHPGNLECDLEERERTGRSVGDVMSGCNRRTKDQHSMAGEDDAAGAKIALDDGGTPVTGAEKDGSPAGQARAPLSAKGRETGDLTTYPSVNGQRAPELNRDDADYKHHSSSGASFNASPTTTTMTTRPNLQNPRPPFGLQREDEGEEEAEAPLAELPPVLVRARTLEREGSPLPTKETKLGGTQVREMGADGCGNNGRPDETNGEEGLRRIRAVVVGTETELLVRLRRCEEESRQREKEAMRLRVERRDLFRRLRMLGQEVEEKVRRGAGLRGVAAALNHGADRLPESTAVPRRLLTRHGVDLHGWVGVIFPWRGG